MGLFRRGYARIYECDHLMLLYPTAPGSAGGERKSFGMTAGMERLRVAQVDIAASREDAIQSLGLLFADMSIRTQFETAA